MRRKTSPLPTRIWSFTALAPTTGGQLVSELLFRQSRYYNQLIEIERARVASYQATRNQFAPELVALEHAAELLDQECAAIAAQIKNARVGEFRKTGKKTLKVPAELAALRDAKSEARKAATTTLREARLAFEARLAPARDAYEERTSGAPAALLAELRAARAQLAEAKLTRDEGATEQLERLVEELTSHKRGFALPPSNKAKIKARVLEAMLTEDWPDAWKALAHRDDQAHHATLVARSECELPPGCYLLVEQATQKAIQDSRPAPPRFRRFTGEGRIGVQLRPNLSTAKLLSGSNGQIRINLRPDKFLGVTKHTHLRSGKGGSYGMVSIRVGTSPDRSPVWAELPVRLHRPLPADAVIKWAWISVRRLGQGLRYELQLTLEAEAFAEPRTDRGTGRVAINFGWCRVPAGVRVAYWAGDDGAAGEITVSQELLRHLERPSLLRAHADQHRQVAYRRLRRWLALAGSKLNRWEWCVSDTRREQIKAHARAYAEFILGDARRPLWDRWKADRKQRGLDLFASFHEVRAWLGPARLQEHRAFWLELWTRKDTHLRRVETHTRRSAANRRDEHFHETALLLSRRYRTLITDNTRIADLARLPTPADKDGQWPEARSQRTQAAPGRLRADLRDVFGDEHSWIVAAAHNTECCARCDAKLEIVGRVGRCHSCGAVLDIDHNNCLNLLRRERERLGDEETPASVRKKNRAQSPGQTGPGALPQGRAASRNERAAAVEKMASCIPPSD